MILADEIQMYESLMERLVAAYRARMTKICKGGDLTPPQFWALVSIRELAKTKMSPLADHLGLSMGAASTLVDRLVSRGFVERCSDPNDRRAVFVSLTPKGNAVLDEAKRAKGEDVRNVFKQLAPEAREHLLSGLEAMADAWERLPADQPCS